MDINDDSFESSYSNKKKPKINSLVVMTGLSLVLGLVAAFGIWEYLNKTQEKVQKLTVTKNVVVAAREIMAGVKITADDLTIKAYTAQDAPSNYSSKPQIFIGRIPKDSISTDEVLTGEKLLEAGSPGGITSLIPKGQRAITVRVNDITGVGGFISPGDRVDVLAVTDSGKKGELISKTILQSVLVLASGEQLIDPNSAPGAASPKGVNQLTFALSLTDAEKLALAVSRGEIRLILRAFGDKDEEEDFGVVNADVYGYPQNEMIPQDAISSQAPQAPQIPKKSIDLILGGSRGSIYF